MSHQDQFAVQKIRRNRQITAVDLSELEKVFVEAGLDTTADIDHVKSTAGGLGLFLRSLTGLEREAAALAFDAFQQGKTLTASQLRFVNELIDYLARNGTIDVAALYESPFTALAPHRPRGDLRQDRCGCHGDRHPLDPLHRRRSRRGSGITVHADCATRA
jgi:type I restriction enzyme R subunit